MDKQKGNNKTFNPKFTNKTVLEILKKYKPIWALTKLTELSAWDQETYMPEHAGSVRGEIMGQAYSLMHKLQTDKEFINLINKAYDNFNHLNIYEQGVVRELKRAVDKATKLPKEFIEKFEKTAVESFMAWKKAKPADDFETFKPYLKKIVELSKQKAELLGYKDHPYDALLDEFESELTVKDLEPYWNKLIPALKNILEKIYNKPNYKESSPIENIKYDQQVMKKLNYKLLEFLQFNNKQARLDIAPHPFTVYLGLYEARITTWYHEKDFRRSFTATAHEWGHALHGLGAHEKLAFTPIEEHNSLVVAESQSRFMEVIVSKTQEFLNNFLKDFYTLSPELKQYSLQDFYEYFNLVKPSLIRVEADELTYHFHIYIRYLVEKSLIEGSLKVDDLPEFWNSKFKELLGITVPNNKVGVMQDVHWSKGYIGYFPTYSMGTITAMQIASKMQKDLNTTISKLTATKQGISKIINYLREKVHIYGGTLTSKQLISQSFGKYLDADAALGFIKDKYL